MNTEEVNPHLTAKIVVSYVAHHRLGPDQLPDLITSIHRAIGQLGRPPEPDEVLIPAVSITRSVRRDFVICLDCGYRGKTLTRHIATRHGLSRDEYRQRWGLRSNHPLTAPAYSEHRSTMAKARGFGRKSTTEVDPAPTPAAAANQKARRTPRSRPASRPEGAATEKAARPTPASKRRSRVRAASPMRCTVSIRNPAMHMFVLSAVGTISALAASRPWRAGVRFAADSALEGTGFELLVRGRVKLVVGRRRQRNRTARRRGLLPRSRRHGSSNIRDLANLPRVTPVRS